MLTCGPSRADRIAVLSGISSCSACRGVPGAPLGGPGGAALELLVGGRAAGPGGAGPPAGEAPFGPLGGLFGDPPTGAGVAAAGTPGAPDAKIDTGGAAPGAAILGAEPSGDAWGPAETRTEAGGAA
jgi:hypothetical protein